MVSFSFNLTVISFSLNIASLTFGLSVFTATGADSSASNNGRSTSQSPLLILLSLTYFSVICIPPLYTDFLHFTFVIPNRLYLFNLSIISLKISLMCPQYRISFCNRVSHLMVLPPYDLPHFLYRLTNLSPQPVNKLADRNDSLLVRERYLIFSGICRRHRYASWRLTNPIIKVRSKGTPVE